MKYSLPGTVSASELIAKRTKGGSVLERQGVYLWHDEMLARQKKRLAKLKKLIKKYKEHGKIQRITRKTTRIKNHSKINRLG